MNKKLLTLIMLLCFGACMPLASIATAASPLTQPKIVTLSSQVSAQSESGTTAAPVLASGGAEPAFRLQWSEGDGGIRVAVSADKLEDLYAYEIHMRFDAAKLRFETANMPSKGFSLQPKVDNDTIKLVHTKTGSVSGTSGTMELAVLIFSRISGGEAAIGIEHAVLVDSQLSRLDKQLSSATLIPASAGSFTFSDTAGHWAEVLLREASGQGWVTGYEDGTFRPDRPITRAELAALLVRAFKLPPADREPLFADAPFMAAWALPHVAAVQAAGLMSGYEDGTFRPARHVTRAELTVVLARVLNLPLDMTMQLSGFKDAERIPAWSRPSTAALVETGIVRGKNGNRFAPLDNATRAEVCSLIVRALAYN